MENKFECTAQTNSLSHNFFFSILFKHYFSSLTFVIVSKKKIMANLGIKRTII